MEGTLTIDAIGNWDEAGPRIYLDGEEIGIISLEDYEVGDVIASCDEEDCSAVYIDGEGDVDVIGGWHEWATCEPEWGSCAVLEKWEEEVGDFCAWGDGGFFEDVVEESDDLDDICSALDEIVRDSTHFHFVPASRYR